MTYVRRSNCGPRGPRGCCCLRLGRIDGDVSDLVNFAVLDEVKRGNGRVVPSRQTQVVQSLEGGIISELLVQEGALVEKDEPLARIEDTTFASQFGEIRERRGAMAARVLRLQAETLGQKSVVFPDELIKAAPRAVETERSVFDLICARWPRTSTLSRSRKTRSRRKSRSVRLRNPASETLTLLNRETDLTRKLYEQKVVPEIEMLRSDRQATDMRGQLAVVRATITKTSAAVQEAHSRLLNVGTAFRAQAEDDLAKSRGDLAVLDENIKSAQDRVRRTELRSPVHGIVNKLNVNTIGAVVAPGASLMEIVPLDDTLLVEGRIRPQDIAFIRPDHEAVVKLSAYNYRFTDRFTVRSSASAPTPSPTTRATRTSAARRSTASWCEPKRTTWALRRAFRCPLSPAWSPPWKSSPAINRCWTISSSRRGRCATRLSANTRA